MGNYISRDEFAKYLADIQYGEAPTGRTGENIDYQNGVYAGLDMAYVALKRFPAADVRPVGEISDAVDEAIDFLNSVSDQMPYHVYSALFDLICGIFPNCGADMREVEP